MRVTPNSPGSADHLLLLIMLSAQSIRLLVSVAVALLDRAVPCVQPAEYYAIVCLTVALGGLRRLRHMAGLNNEWAIAGCLLQVAVQIRWRGCANVPGHRSQRIRAAAVCLPTRLPAG
jgi:hypothetical protein